eukprot:1158694-Pelagomonas_calceolata.AAC.4
MRERESGCLGPNVQLAVWVHALSNPFWPCRYNQKFLATPFEPGYPDKPPTRPAEYLILSVSSQDPLNTSSYRYHLTSQARHRPCFSNSLLFRAACGYSVFDTHD